MSWHNESRRHSLASKGVKTGTKVKPMLRADQYKKKAEPYPIYKLSKNERKEAISELKDKGYFHYVYFETPFSYRYIGVNNPEQAKEVYNKIMNTNKDLYGCVVSIKNTNQK